MAYTYRFYRFASLTAFLAEWAAAGLPVVDGAPLLPGGALDVVGAVSLPAAEEGASPVPVPGFHVNAAWPGEAPASLAPFAIGPFEGLRVFAGWSTPAPPPPVPERITNFQARAVLRTLPGGSPGRSLLDEVNDALRAMGGAAWDAWEYANELTRHGELVGAMAARFGLSAEDLDGLFRAGAGIEA